MESYNHPVEIDPFCLRKSLENFGQLDLAWLPAR
jgi:hypothetical protein